MVGRGVGGGGGEGGREPLRKKESVWWIWSCTLDAWTGSYRTWRKLRYATPSHASSYHSVPYHIIA